MRINNQLIQGGYATGVCSICGHESVAIWTGEKTIEICSTCATEKLPLLIADSVGHANPVHAESAAKSIESAFWRGMALRAMSESKAKLASAPLN